MPTIEEVIAAQRRRLALGEARLTFRVAELYRRAADEALRIFETTASELTQQRMLVILDGIEEEMTKAAAGAIPLVKAQQAAAVLQAGRDLGEQLRGLDLTHRIDPLANERMFAALSPESPLAELLGRANMAGLAKARSALFTGVALGSNPLKIAPKLRQALDIPRWRAETIATTEVLRTYRGSTRERMRQQGFDQWRWISAHDGRTCAMCWAMHGTLHPISESLGSHPRCRCSQSPVPSDGGLDVTSGEDEFADLSEREQRNILGDAKFKAYDSGAVTLSDLVAVETNPRWGTVRYEKSLSAVLGGDAARSFYKGARTPSSFVRQVLRDRRSA